MGNIKNICMLFADFSIIHVSGYRLYRNKYIIIKSNQINTAISYCICFINCGSKKPILEVEGGMI